MMKTFLAAILLASIVGCVEHVLAALPTEQRSAYAQYARDMKRLVDDARATFPAESWGAGSGGFEGYDRCARRMAALSEAAWRLQTPPALALYDAQLRRARQQLGAAFMHHSKGCQAGMRLLDGPGRKLSDMQEMKRRRANADRAAHLADRAMQGVAAQLKAQP